MNKKDIEEAVANGISEGMAEVVSTLVEIRDAIGTAGWGGDKPAAPADEEEPEEPEEVEEEAEEPEEEEAASGEFNLGDEVVAYLADEEGNADWYESEIVAMNSEGEFTIKTQDGDEIPGVGPGYLAAPEDEDRILAIEGGELDEEEAPEEEPEEEEPEEEEPEEEEEEVATKKTKKKTSKKATSKKETASKKDKAAEEAAKEKARKAKRTRLAKGVPYTKEQLQSDKFKRQDLVMLASYINEVAGKKVIKNPLAKQALLINSIIKYQKVLKKGK